MSAERTAPEFGPAQGSSIAENDTSDDKDRLLEQPLAVTTLEPKQAADALPSATMTGERSCPDHKGSDTAPPTANPPSPHDVEPDADAEILRLASLARLAYDQERKSAAKKLGIRATILDKLVSAARHDSISHTDQGQALKLPSPERWPEPVDGARLLTELTAAIKRYMVMAEGAAESAALWVLANHALEAFQIFPRLAITSPEKGCGKTTLLDIVGRLVPRPLLTSNTTTAAVFRTIELARPTLLIDEADTFLTRNDELRGILNSGHTRSAAYVVRVAGDEHEPRRFSTWAAVAIAMIGSLPSTLEDRSILVILRRRLAHEAVTRFRPDRCPDLDTLARKCARFAADHLERLTKADPEVPTSLQNRAADNWRPLLAIADAAGGNWPALARQIAEACARAVESVPSHGVQLLGDIRLLFERQKCDRFHSQLLVDFLRDLEESPWAESNRGRPLTKNGLAWLLRRFGIRPATIRTQNGTAKGYRREHFEDAFSRYLSPAPDRTVTPSQP